MIRNIIPNFPYLRLHLFICPNSTHKCINSFATAASSSFCPVLCFLFKLLKRRGLLPLFFCSFRILINLSCIKYFKIYIFHFYFFYSCQIQRHQLSFYSFNTAISGRFYCTVDSLIHYRLNYWHNMFLILSLCAYLLLLLIAL